jgi:ABC-2 type transport system ATP-binding protein
VSALERAVADPVIHIQGLVKRYGPNLAVDGVSLQVLAGECFGYLGPNGAGKTTTIRCLLGLIRPTAGSVRLGGHDIRVDLAAALRDVGYLPGEFNLWPQLTGRECLEYLGRLQPRPPTRRDELCDRFHLSHGDLDKQIRRYSRGMKQKVGIIQAFQHEPSVVILDEPTEGLDPLMKERFVELLREYREGGGTVFLSSHILSEVEEVAGRVGVLRDGRLVKVGPPSDLTGERVRHCTISLKSPADTTALRRVLGTSDIVEDRLVLRFSHRGDMAPLLKALALLPVEEFLAEPESLAESFLEVYEDGTEETP